MRHELVDEGVVECEPGLTRVRAAVGEDALPGDLEVQVALAERRHERDVLAHVIIEARAHVAAQLPAAVVRLPEVPRAPSVEVRGAGAIGAKRALELICVLDDTEDKVFAKVEEGFGRRGGQARQQHQEHGQERDRARARAATKIDPPGSVWRHRKGYKQS